MDFEVDGTVVRLTKGDITDQEVDAVVNAANSSLMGGGGVDGAIHNAGGPAIREECEVIREQEGRLATGDAVATTAGDLPAEKVIHAVGPRWKGGDEGEPEELAGAYTSSLQIAVDEGLVSIAFPSISTGAYGYPINKAAAVAFDAIDDFLSEHAGEIEEIRFVLFSDKDLSTYKEAAETYLQGR